MGKQIHLKKIEALFEKSPVLDFKSVEKIVGVGEKSSYAKLLISNLLKKGAIKKVGKGVYTKHSESSLVVFAFKPAYLGLQTALSHLNIWEQETIPIILTTRKVRRGLRNVMNSNVLIKNINKKYFFGFEFTKEEKFYLPYSDLEKTLIDMVVFNQKVEEKTIRLIKKRLSIRKLRGYLKEYPSNIRRRVLKILKLKD